MSRCYFENIILQISNSFKSLNEDCFASLIDECEQAIQNGGKIVATGLGKNVPICEKFVGTMSSLGIPAAFLHTNTAMHGDLGIIKKGDILLVLSKSGSTAESIILADYTKDWEIGRWLLSFNNGGTLGAKLDNKILLDLEHEGDSWNIVPNNSSSCYLILLQGVALCLSERLKVSLADFKLNHPGGAIGDKLNGL